MKNSPSKNQSPFFAVFLIVSGILFALYPALRPFSDEKSLEGAAAIASGAWFFAHMAAILAFILLPFGLAGICKILHGPPEKQSPGDGTPGPRWNPYPALGISCFGTGLTLPFYGAELFGLQAVGVEAVKTQSAALLILADQIRFGKGFPVICTGLLLLAAGIVLIAAAVWRSKVFYRWSGIPLAVGFVLYLPQYMAAKPWRAAHGLLVAAGCIWLGVLLLGKNRRQDAELGKIP